MSRHSNISRIGGLLTFLVVAASALPSITVHAISANEESAFCTNLSSLTDKVTGNMTTLITKLDITRASRDQTIAANRTKWEQDIAASRTKWDAKRDMEFATLTAKAKTDAQKAAVKTYQADLTAAIATRRSANDAARNSYRQAVDAALASQRSTIDGEVSTFKSSIATAEAGARTGCQVMPGSGASLRANYQLTLKSARQSFSIARKADKTSADQVKALAATRDAAIKANDAAFAASAKTAADKLKAAFKG